MKLYAYRAKKNKGFMITSRDKEDAECVLKAWYLHQKIDFEKSKDTFELITLKVEEEES